MGNNDSKLMDVIILPAFVWSLWDAFTTFTGVMYVLNSKPLAVFLSVSVYAILASTYKILNSNDPQLSFLARFVWAVAVIGDLVSAFYGNRNFAHIDSDNGAALFLLIVISILTTASVIFISWYLYRKNLW